MKGLLRKKIVLDSTSAPKAEETRNVYALDTYRVLCPVLRPTTTTQLESKHHTNNVIVLRPARNDGDIKRWERDAGL